MGTYEPRIYSDQLWLLEAHPYAKNYFYIKNCAFKGYRISLINTRVGVQSGNYHDGQLWKFVNAGNGFYR